MNEEAALRGKVELGRGFQLSTEHLPRSHVRIPAQGLLADSDTVSIPEQPWNTAEEGLTFIDIHQFSTRKGINYIIMVVVTIACIHSIIS